MSTPEAAPEAAHRRAGAPAQNRLALLLDVPAAAKEETRAEAERENEEWGLAFDLILFVIAEPISDNLATEPQARARNTAVLTGPS